ncbi:MAG: TonB-dependent receptor, partial [Flavobacterium sp.]|nr:TonB-dependent receptor [Pedobacter sp.]
GYNMDAGIRGILKNYLNYDVSLFYLKYNNRIGITQKTDANGIAYPFRTNIANSTHKGIESYFELNAVKLFSSDTQNFSVSVFNSMAYIDAKYSSGEYKGKSVEYAPMIINRSGLTGHYKNISATYLVSYTAKSYGDAGNNVIPSEDAVSGVIPAYRIMDLSMTIKAGRYNLKAGSNNLSDNRYFTKRTDEYPGPGIIPSIGRTFYVGLGAKF